MTGRASRSRALASQQLWFPSSCLCVAAGLTEAASSQNTFQAPESKRRISQRARKRKSGRSPLAIRLTNDSRRNRILIRVLHDSTFGIRAHSYFAFAATPGRG